LLRELPAIHYHHELPFGNLVPCDSPHLELPNNRQTKSGVEIHAGECGLSGSEISRIVEVDRLALRPHGIRMTEEELVALAYQLRDDSDIELSASREGKGRRRHVVTAEHARRRL
jgi:hypothetical protein